MMSPREQWTDERLDDLNKKVDDGFARMDARFEAQEARMDARFQAQEARMDARFEHLEGRFDAFNRTLWQVGGMIFAALLGILATQL